jgi:hypothetical protein
MTWLRDLLILIIVVAVLLVLANWLRHVVPIEVKRTHPPPGVVVRHTARAHFAAQDKSNFTSHYRVEGEQR